MNPRSRYISHSSRFTIDLSSERARRSARRSVPGSMRCARRRSRAARCSVRRRRAATVRSCETATNPASAAATIATTTKASVDTSLLR
jgi:hypothetical protein